MPKLLVRTAIVLALVFICAGALTLAQEQSPQSARDEAKADLSVEQAQLADRWDRLEQIASRLAELSAASDPHRADLLRKAIAQAREKEVHLRFEEVVGLLEKERYSNATKTQEALEAELQQLLDLLLKENRAEELRSHQAWLRAQLKEVNRIIRLQRGVKARTQGGDDTDRLADDQQKIAARTGELADQVEAAKGGSPDGAEAENGSEGRPREGDSGEGNESEEENKPGNENTDEESSQDEGDDSSDEGESGEEPADPDESQSTQEDPAKSNGQQPESGEQPADPSGGSPQESQQGSPQGGQPQGGQPGQPQPGQQGQPNPGTPSEGQQGEGGQGEEPPSANPEENLQRRLRAAQENMERARQKLEEAQAKGATEQQEQALKELEEARAELERVLRQLREEEMERTLALLEVRFRRMLEMQIAVYEGTQRLDAVPQDARDHDDEIESGRLARQEEAIVREADTALEILLDEGTSVAFPEAVTQMRSDMQDVAARLAKVDVGPLTQSLEQEIIEQLEESIEALQQALEELEKNKTPPGEAPPPGEPQDPPLVDQLEEVKMIRALQMRINRRTQRFSEMIDGSIAADPELVRALAQLAERQDRVYKATRDLHLGKNQ